MRFQFYQFRPFRQGMVVAWIFNFRSVQIHIHTLKSVESHTIETQFNATHSHSLWTRNRAHIPFIHHSESMKMSIQLWRQDNNVSALKLFFLGEKMHISTLNVRRNAKYHTKEVSTNEMRIFNKFYELDCFNICLECSPRLAHLFNPLKMRIIHLKIEIKEINVINAWK